MEYLGDSLHSPIGASSAHRWLACPGSVRLSAGCEDDTSEYAAEGTVAHHVAAVALSCDADAWEAAGKRYGLGGGSDGYEFTVDDEMVFSVQQFVDYVRDIGGELLVEERFALPDVHPLLFGTSDASALRPDLLAIADFKYGRGIAVDAENNEQLAIYALGLVRRAHERELPVGQDVLASIVQPRAFHPDGEIREWRTTVAELEEWARDVLAPGAAATQKPDAPLHPGDYCRFCPARGHCPALRALTEEVAEIAQHNEVGEFTDETVGELREKLNTLAIFKKAIEGEAYNRLMQGRTIPGAKLVERKADRKWKDDADEALIAKYGEDAYKPLTLKSPAEIEKLPGGRKITSRHAYKPDAGLTVASLSDKRASVRRTASDVFKDVGD